uniref:NmrA-like domain-containing protein n=1 Tax=Thalassiosira weissflogii TaxID=1577725 RepID=A0A089X960_THAWE|nr:hypothetical protein Ycf39 [Conticribra weissflogii]AIR76149.1 hypothetical protein Ycf39 [Conticribra weissflogii]
MSLLIVGGTGTLGRQIVLQALTRGYPVKCLVRNFSKANFLKEWGAELIYGDLSIPETIPACFQGITAVIDASTSRPSDYLDSVKTVDLDGKLALIKAAKVAKVKRFIFCSPENLEEFSEKIPLMKMKQEIEFNLKESQIPYTIFRLTGFYQGLIEQYAIPILENLPIWVTNENAGLAYMDTQDIAKFCVKSLQLPKMENRTIFLTGPVGWVSSDIIKLCEKLAGQSAKVNQIPLFILRFITQFLGFFEWGQNISDRLAFLEILDGKNRYSTQSKMYELYIFLLYKDFKVKLEDTTFLEDYFLEYFIRLLKRLRDINFEDIQKQKNLII